MKIGIVILVSPTYQAGLLYTDDSYGGIYTVCCSTTNRYLAVRSLYLVLIFSLGRLEYSSEEICAKYYNSSTLLRIPLLSRVDTTAGSEVCIHITNQHHDCLISPTNGHSIGVGRIQGWGPKKLSKLRKAASASPRYMLSASEFSSS